MIGTIKSFLNEQFIIPMFNLRKYKFPILYLYNIVFVVQ